MLIMRFINYRSKEEWEELQIKVAKLLAPRRAAWKYHTPRTNINSRPSLSLGQQVWYKNIPLSLSLYIYILICFIRLDVHIYNIV